MIEFPTRHEFHQRTEYQQWRGQFRPPPGPEVWFDHEHQQPPTPRQSHQLSWGTLSYHWLFHTIHSDQHRCVDVGCGGHPLKEQGVWGVDPDSDLADEAMTPGWWHLNQGRWARAFSVNSLHFGPVDRVVANLTQFRGLLRPGGRAVCALNRRRIWESENNTNRSGALVQALRNLPGVSRVIWFREPGAPGGPPSREHAPVDGNVWIWFRA